MDFSVAVCTWNRAQSLADTFESFLGLRVPAHLSWEIVVINNGSTDGTSQVVADFADRLPVREVIEPRRGTAVARNRALAECRGDRILWTDDDVQIDPEWATSLLDAFDEHHADVVFGRSHPVWLGPMPSWYGSQFLGQFAGLDYGARAFEVKDNRHLFYNLNLAFGRNVIAAVGGYREDLGYVGNKGGAGEDTDLFERILAAGLKIVYEPAAVIGHCISSERATARRQRQLAWQGARTNYLMVSGAHANGPRWRGIPRYMFRIAFDDGMLFAKAALKRQRSEAFYREIRLLRFVGLVREALRHRAVNVDGATPQTTT